MNMISIASHEPFQKLYPLSLLAQSVSRQTSGCLRVSDGSASWSIYLYQGRLTYASNSVDPFGRLDRHLRQLSQYVPTLVSAVRVQVRLLFDRGSGSTATQVPDYQAICWLVEQQYLNLAQASTLIENIAKEVIGQFLQLQQGAYELIDREKLIEFPQLCQLELRPLVEYCQHQLRQRSPQRSRPPAAPARPSPQYQERAAAPSAGPMAPGAPKATKAGIAKSTYTIACIDDSPTVLQAIKAFLDDTSFSVIMISNPVQALMQIVRSKPDLILLDVEMPNLDGYELCSLLRRHPMFKTTPIIMVTGNTGFIDRAKAKLVRASGYLTKPFTQPDLLKMVFKHLT
ncbi:MAG: response regulator [Cyanobacteria bacterium P01_A01_bin.135]